MRIRIPIEERKKLCLEIDKEMHRLIKMAASMRYITLNKWVMRAIEKQLVEEGHIEL